MLFILLSGCSKDEKTPECGRDGKIIFTINDNDNQQGYLYKRTDYSENNNIPNYNYGIWYASKNCSNCIHTFFILNDTFLNSFGDIPPYPGTLIQFSGTAKNLCVNPVAPTDYTYNYLTLTKIIRQ
ncbi:hypothetical protein C3L50_10455 [Flavobacterium alvei]|uniref:Uncharacterized protein n=2 Tax=Flavobacterium alvei TaxID=2080416 RepID=A0A2S5ABC6_9FLAO|nr:hypothetical protein C3L50_10455 [Flavobacterium alvei]